MTSKHSKAVIRTAGKGPSPVPALPFSHLIISILRMGKTGLQREMDSFFKEAENEVFSIRRITKGSFSKARKNLAPEAFLDLNGII